MHPFDRYSALVLLGTLLAPSVRAGVVMPPDGGILPWEIDSSLVGGSVACPMWSEQFTGLGTIKAYRTWTYRKPCQMEARENWELFEGRSYLGTAERYHYEPGSNRLLSMSMTNWERPAPGLPRTVLWGTDSTRYFWREGVLDSTWSRSWRDSGHGHPGSETITGTRFIWSNGRPVARQETSIGSGFPCIRESRWSATYRGDTLAEAIDSTSYRAAPGGTCGTAPSIRKTIWRYRSDTVEALAFRWSGDSATWFPGEGIFFALHPDGQTEQQIIAYPDSFSPRWWESWAHGGFILAYAFDAQGRQSKLHADGGTWAFDETYHYDEPSPLFVRSGAVRAPAMIVRVVGGRIRFELSRPASVAIALVAPDGRVISLGRKLPLAAGPQSLALPADLPRGVWIVRLEGDSVDLAATWVNAGR